MSPAKRSRAGAALLAGALLVGLLPATAMAASPTAVDQTPGTLEDVDLPIVLTGTDPDGDALTFTIETQPSNGTLSTPSSPDCNGSPSTCTVDLTYTPDPDTNGSDSFTFSVNDGIDSPDTATVDITVDADNDPPVNDVPGSQTTTEDTTKTFSTGNGNAISIGDVDLGSGDPEVTLTATHGTITLSGTSGLSFTAGDGTNDATMTFSGGTMAQANTALNGMTYNPTAQYHGAATLTILTDDQGGTGAGGAQTDSDAVAITVTSVNDAPSGADNTISTPEDTAYVFVEADFGFTDPNDSPADDLESVKITTLPAQGSLTYNGGAVSAGTDIPRVDLVAGLLEFTPGLNDEGSPYATFTFQVEDDGGGNDLDLTPNTITINVAPPFNDPPSGTNKTVTILEDGSHVFVASDFGFTDPSDDPDDNLESVKIASLPVAGSLTNGGTPVVSGTDIDVADINAGDLVFTPAADGDGASYASFTFQVRDDGGGSDLDPSANTITVNVTGVNDAPAGADKTVGIVEDTPYPFVASDFGFTDPADSPADSLLAVKIVAIFGAGALEFDGDPVVAGQSVSAADIALGKLVFAPASGANGDDYATFTFQVRDDGGTLDSGIDLDPTADTITVDVGPVNNAPSGTSKTVTTREDVPLTLVVADFGFADALDSPADELLAVKVSTLPALGILSNDGIPVADDAFIPVADITANKLVFTPAANARSSPYTTFTFQVQDDGGTVSGGVDVDQGPNTITINVTAVNDAPSGTDKTVTTPEESAYTFAPTDFTITDANDVPPAPGHSLTAVKITTLPAAGSLKNDNVAVTLGQVIAIADITANKLVFTPVANGSGLPYTTFTFQVQDNGGTGNGGVDLDPTPNTITVNVSPSNDNPVARNDTTLSVPESAGATALNVLGNDTDVDGDTLLITSTTAALHGTVTITGGGTGLTYDPVQLYFGTDTFKYTINDGHGGAPSQATVLITVVKDTTPPTVIGPAEQFYAQTVASKTMNAKISWSGSDAGTGIKKYEIQVSVNGGAFANTALTTPTSINRTLTDEKSYRYRVRGHDNQGNISAWVNGPTFKPGRIQNNSTSVVYAGPWATVSTASALGGSHRYASSLSARASVTRTTRDFALVMTKTSTSGMAEVRIDGVLAATINLHSSSTVYRQLVYSRHFGSLGSHTIEVRPIGGTRIYLDAFLVMR